MDVDLRLTSRIVIGASPILHAAIMESFRNDAGYPPKGTAMRNDFSPCYQESRFPWYSS